MISNDESPLPDTEVHDHRSEHVGHEFKIFVGHPPSSDTAPEPASPSGVRRGSRGEFVATAGSG
jgi:hypothetical protein